MELSTIQGRVIWLADQDPASDRAASKAAGFNETYLRDVRDAKKNRIIGPESARQLAEYYGCNLSWLLYGEGPPFSGPNGKLSAQIAEESAALPESQQQLVLDMIRQLASTIQLHPAPARRHKS